MANIAEQLTILSDLGEGLLIRLYNIKVKYDGASRPTYMSDPTLAKVVAALPKKFPELPTELEKVPGYEVFASRAPQLFQELEADYETFIDTNEWVRVTTSSLTDITQSLSNLQLDENPLVLAGYMDLVVKFVQLNILITLIFDRRTIITAYARLYYIIKNNNEPNFSKIARVLHTNEDPFKTLPTIMRPFSRRIGQALGSLVQPYMKVNDLQYLRKEGMLNITLNPDKIAMPSQSIMQLNFCLRDKMLQWILWGYLFCPDELERPGTLALVRMGLTHCWRLPVFRDVTVSVHVFYDAAWKNYKSKTFKLGKERKVIAEAANASALGEGAVLHHSFRIYLRQSLSTLYCVLKDFPGLLGPKLTLLWSGLTAAKAEILWYFRQIGADPPKTKDKFSRDNFRDRHISELLHLVCQHIHFIRQHQRIIQNYYLEYLHGADALDLQKQIAKHTTLGDVAPILQDILRELQAINPSTDGSQKFDFSALRLNWYRAEAKLSATSAIITASQAKELIHRGRLIYLHSRNVDNLEEQLEEFASLKMLWYFRDLLIDAFDKAILDGPSNPLYTASYLHLLAEFPENTTPFLPEEKEFIGPETVKLAQSMLEKIMQRVAAVMMEIGKNYLAYNDQLKPENAAYPLLLRQKDYKFDKSFIPPVTPGEESQFKARQDLDALRLYERNVQQLCASLQEYVDVAIYDHKFIPREFLREKLSSVLRSFIRQAVQPGGDAANIQRPTVLETQFNIFFSTIKLVENHVDIDIGDLLREVCLKQIHNKAVSEIHKIDWTAEGEITWGNDVYLMKPVSKWYGDFVSKKLNQPGISYSANRRAFISRTTMPFRAEEYADLAELSALCRLVGPYGVKAIDREVMKSIVDHIGYIKMVLRANRQPLEFIAQNFHKDVAAQIKSLKDVDELLTRSIAIGNALQFRELLHHALFHVVKQATPYATQTIGIIFDEYQRNTFMKPEFLEMDAIATSLGMDVGTADQALKAILSKIIGEQDKPLWKLLPFLYSSSFVASKVWGEAQYHSTIEAHSNNVHTLSLAINALLIAVESTSETERGVGAIIELLCSFVQSASCILLRQAQQSLRQTEKMGISSFPSLMIFMDKFIQDSPLLKQNELEAVMPYPLLRTMYKSLYEAAREKGKKGAKGPAPPENDM